MANSDRTSQTWQVTPDLLGVLGKGGRLKDTNPAWFKALSHRPEDVENRKFCDLIHPDDMARTESAFRDLQQGRPVLQFINRLRHSDGSFRWLSWNAVPEGDSFYCSGRDVTANKENAAALKTCNEEALYREQFVAVLGHDLRNPLAAIRSAARIMARDQQTPKVMTMLDAINGSVARMSGLVDDVVDFAQARLGQGIVLDRRKGEPLQPMLEQTVSEVALAHASIRIETQYDFTDPIYCDHGRVGQLTAILLGNAVSHGDTSKPIRLSVTDAKGGLVLSVSNAGAPVSEEECVQLFKPFFRSNSDAGHRGLGLGLFIAAEIARAHGGAMSFLQDGDRTEFSFTMPLA